MAMDIKDLVGPDRSCLLIAEAGVNHNGDMGLAHDLIDAALEAGANAVKFQAFVTEEIVTARATKAAYQKDTTGSGDQFEMLKALELSAEQQAELKSHCERIGLFYLCTPYDFKSVDMLGRLGVHAFKVASTDTNNIPLLRQVAKTGLPAILSTGMATLSEVEDAIGALQDARPGLWLALLQCTTEYPAPVGESNLRVMETFRQAFGLPVGLSDHTTGIGVAPLAVALGANIVEKHFTLDRSMAGPDHAASLDPSGFKDLVAAVRDAEAALGDGRKEVTPSESKNKVHMRKSVVANQDIAAGTAIKPEHLACKRPGDGLEPAWFDKIVGRVALRDIEKDQQISLADVQW